MQAKTVMVLAAVGIGAGGMGAVFGATVLAERDADRQSRPVRGTPAEPELRARLEEREAEGTRRRRRRRRDGDGNRDRHR